MIVDDGPPDEDEYEACRGRSKPTRMDVEGIVRLSLLGSKDELRGALLEGASPFASGPRKRVICRTAAPRLAHRGPRLRTSNKAWRAVVVDEIGPNWRSLKSARG